MSWYARYLAQLEIDKDALVLANFDWAKVIHFLAIQTMINDVHAERVASKGKCSTPGDQLRSLGPKMKTYRKRSRCHTFYYP